MDAQAEALRKAKGKAVKEDTEEDGGAGGDEEDEEVRRTSPPAFNPAPMPPCCPVTCASPRKLQVEFDADEEEDSDEESSNDSSDDDDEDEDVAGGGEAELDELHAEAAGAADAEAGPSSGRKRRASGDPDESKIVAGLSGDEVDAGLIIAGGRGARRGRAPPGGSKPKYTAKAQLDSDEDDW